MKNKKQKNTTGQLIGAKSFGRNGLQTTRHGELCFYLIRPVNISVLSETSVAVKVNNLMQLLIAQPDIEICCLDDQECFDSNKEYLTERVREESNPKIRSLLDRDRGFLDEIQQQMSTARQFMLIVRLRGDSEKSFANLAGIEKEINDRGFDVKRADKSDIKRILMIYFGGNVMNGELPDYDGEEAGKWIIPD